jgi:hypothetical protein
MPKAYRSLAFLADGYLSAIDIVQFLFSLLAGCFKDQNNMSMNILSKPKFYHHQTVRFIGGVGKIKSMERQDSRWTYAIEMSMGEQPDFGRVGEETTIVLEEQDISQLTLK